MALEHTNKKRVSFYRVREGWGRGGVREGGRRKEDFFGGKGVERGREREREKKKEQRTYLVICLAAKAIAYSATTVFPAEV